MLSLKLVFLIVYYVVMSETYEVVKDPLKPEEILSGQVQIRSVKTGNVIGVETLGIRSEVYAKDKLLYDTWVLQRNTNLSDPFYSIALPNSRYRWIRRAACWYHDEDIITYVKGEYINENFYYDPKTQLITVCDGQCVFVDSINNHLRATKNCDREEDKYFRITSLSQPSPTPVIKKPLKPEEILSGQVHIRSVKTGNVIGVGTSGNANIVYAKDKLANDTWEVEPNTNIGAPFYFIALPNSRYQWNSRYGCEGGDREIITFLRQGNRNEKFYYDPKKQLITVCDGLCVFVSSINNQLRATKNCSREEDKYFSITSSQSTPTTSVVPSPAPSVQKTVPVIKEPLKPEEILSGQVQIRSVKTGNVIGVGALGNANIVYAKDKLANDTWEVQPNTNISDPFYFIALANSRYQWNRRYGCEGSDREIITFLRQGNRNEKFYYDPKTQLITVCDGLCVFVDSINNRLRATKNCSREKDKYFSITSSQSSPTPSVVPSPTPPVHQTAPVIKEPLQPEEILSGHVHIRSVKTGNVIGVGALGNANIVYAKDKLANDTWEVQPNTNRSDPFYFIALPNSWYQWNRRYGCQDSDREIITFLRQGNRNEKFYYDPKKQLITVCDGLCVFVDSINNHLRATKNCSREEDKYFSITSSQSSPTPSVVPSPTPPVHQTVPVIKEPLKAEEILSGQVHIRSVKTGNVIGVGTLGNENTVYAKDKLSYDAWEVQPSTNLSDPFYFIALPNSWYQWNRRHGCYELDEDIITHVKGEYRNEKFYYYPKTQLITVCDGYCVYVATSNNKLRSTMNCSREEDKYFSITYLYEPSPTPLVAAPPTPSVVPQPTVPVIKEPLKPEEILSGQVHIRSVKTGNVLSVGKLAIGHNVYAKDNLSYDTWEVQINNNLSDPFYFIAVPNSRYQWNRGYGCYDADEDIIIHVKGEDRNEKFYYDPKTQLITVCDGHCVFVDSINNTLRATKNCSREEDKYFRITSISQPAPAPDSCYSTSSPNVIYNLRLTKVNWKGAIAACQSIGSSLVSIQNKQKSDKIYKILKDAGLSFGDVHHAIWTSGNRLQNEKNWVWLAQEPFAFTNWYVEHGEPNNYDGNEKCVSLLEVNGTSIWNDEGCNKELFPLCEKPVLCSVSP